MDYRLTLSYCGGTYAGWQRQTNALAVQQVFEDALEDLLGEPVRTMGAGRTDRGVHARGQVVSLRLEREWPAGALVHGINQRLPAEVRVLAATVTATGFDARKHALAKEYRYQLRRDRVLSPLDAPFTVRLAEDVELERLQRAAEAVVGRHDFTAFARQGGAHSDPRRRVLRSEWTVEGPVVTFRVVGEGFLRGMVRALVGTMLEIGAGRRPEDDMARLLAGRSRSEAGPTAPAKGLVLQRVFYPERWGGPAAGW